MPEPTAERVLDVAQDLIQTRGFNGFSFRDVAAAVGIRSASIHYHYPSKTDLGVALLERYRLVFAGELAQIEIRHETAPQRLKSLTGLFRRTLTEDRLCLCGMLGAERGSLPNPVNDGVSGFFSDCEAWLTEVLKQGRSNGEIAFRGSPQAMADHLLALLEGAMIVARSLDDLDRFDKATNAFLRVLKPVSET